MKRQICLILAVIHIVLVCGGCTNKKASVGNEKVKISVGNWPNSNNASAYALRQTLLEKFNKKYPNIEIEPDTWQFSVQSFLPKAASGQLPTVYEAYYTESNRIIDAGYAADITNAVKKYGYDKMLNKDLENLVSKDGKYYLIPKSTYALGLTLNLDLFKQAGLMEEDGTPIYPKTYEELALTAEKITKATGKPGFLLPTTNNGGGWLFTVIAWSFGVDFMEKIDGKWKATFNTPECAEALQYIKDLKWKYNTFPANILNNTLETRKLLATDQGAMILMPPPFDNLHQYGMKKDSIGIVPIPSGKKRHVSLMGGAYKAISQTATEAQIDAAMKWIEYEGISPYLSDVVKDSLAETYENDSKEGKLIGAKTFSPWNTNSELLQYIDSLDKKYLNVNINHINKYSNFDGIEIQPEEPMCCQNLYGILDSCIQSVLTNKDADCAELLEHAEKNFQINYLDNAE